MAHSLEVRVPFLDYHVVEYCARIPADLKVRRLQTKYVLKQAATGIVPDRIIHKRKLGFLRGSTEAWLQAQLHDAVPDLLFGADVRCAEFVDPGHAISAGDGSPRWDRRVQRPSPHGDCDARDMAPGVRPRAVSPASPAARPVEVAG